MPDNTGMLLIAGLVGLFLLSRNNGNGIPVSAFAGSGPMLDATFVKPPRDPARLEFLRTGVLGAPTRVFDPATGLTTIHNPESIGANSADEDIGVFPARPLAAVRPPTEIVAGSGILPVIAQNPVPVRLTGSPSSGFQLIGGSGSLTGATPVAVSNPSVEPFFEEFTTTPFVLADLLGDPAGPLGPTAPFNTGNIFDPDAAIQVNAPFFDTDLL